MAGIGPSISMPWLCARSAMHDGRTSAWSHANLTGKKSASGVGGGGEHGQLIGSEHQSLSSGRIDR
jgi:hypothetical protein